MSESASQPLTESSIADLPAPASEGFWGTVIRRSRYAVAIALSAILFSTVGWKIAAPPPDFAGVSLLVWPDHSSTIMILGLLGILLAAVALSSLICYHDAPHIGLYCALLGMAGLAIRGGNINLLVHIHNLNYPALWKALAIESLQWAVILFIAERFCLLLHEKFFANTDWITRSGADAAITAMHRSHTTTAALGVAAEVSKIAGTRKLPRLAASILAPILIITLSLFLLGIFMQTELKGQILFACFTSFLLSTLLVYLVVPQAHCLAFLLSVPFTAAVAYLWGMNDHIIFPGHPAFYATRALPIDYIAAGVPGAILGYYAAFRWALHSAEESE